MSTPTGINFSRLGFAILIIGSLVYSFIISRRLTPDMREMVNISLQYGFYAGYGLWVLGIVLTNAAAIRRITRRSYAGNSGIGTEIQIWQQTLAGVFKASIISPITARKVIGAHENLLQKLIIRSEIYLLRPLATLVCLAAYAIVSAALILPKLLIGKLLTGSPGEEATGDEGHILPIFCIAGADTTRKSLLQALTSALGTVSTPRWFQYDTPRINASTGQPKYHYGEILLARKKNSKLPTHSLRICNFEGSDTASITMLDTMPFFAGLRGGIIIVEESAPSASVALAFDKWYELMSTAHKTQVEKLKCAIVIRPNAKRPACEGACELYAGADKNTCIRFLRENQQTDILQKSSLFRNTAFFAISAGEQELNECPGVHALAKWLLTKAI